jgi:tetratricopeptide (TPR) repeat protein
MKGRAYRWQLSGLGAAVALLLGAGIAVAQDEHEGQFERSNTISGHIEIEGGGGPSERLEISLERVTGAGSRRIISEPGGSFFISGVRPGNYTLTVKPPLATGFTEGSAEVMIASGRSTSNYVVTIFIKRKERDSGVIIGGRLISAQESDAAVPKEARKAYKQGSEAARNQRTREAIEYFQRALEIAPDYLFALNDLGVQYSRVGRYDDSIQVLERAVAKAPTSLPPHVNLAIAHLGRNDLEKASAELVAALRIDASAYDVLYLSGVVERRRGNVESAVSAFQRAYDAGGADAIFAQFELGQLYDEAGQAEAATRAYSLFLQFVQQGPQAAHARRRLAELARG